MSRLTVAGIGAVTAAGWGLEALDRCLRAGTPLASELLVRTADNGRTVQARVRRVPEPLAGRWLLRVPRLRRASRITKMAAAALCEAMGMVKEGKIVPAPRPRVGIICAVRNGCVNYTNRFYGEVLDDPATASPILFPETVYNAPASHLAALLGSTAPCDTLIGDSNAYFHGLDLASEWLESGQCDAVAVIGAEELDWLSAEALGYYNRGLIASEGAAAVVLERAGEGIELQLVSDGLSQARDPERHRAFAALWKQLEAVDDGATVWADGRCGNRRLDAAESSMAWGGPRLSTGLLLGEAMGAAPAVQTVAALLALRKGWGKRAVITAAGGSQGAGGCAFVRRN